MRNNVSYIEEGQASLIGDELSHTILRRQALNETRIDTVQPRSAKCFFKMVAIFAEYLVGQPNLGRTVQSVRYHMCSNDQWRNGESTAALVVTGPTRDVAFLI